MVIWQGWGILAVVYALLAGMLFGGAASTFLTDDAIPFSAAIGFVLAAAATWFTGVHLNRTSPQRKVDEWAGQRRSQLDQLVEAGQFSPGPGQPQPQSVGEAREMSDVLFEREQEQVRGAFNRHTLFWIPMQYIAVLWIGIAIFAIFTGATR